MSFSLDVKQDLLSIPLKGEEIDKLEIESMLRASGEVGIIPVSLSFSSSNIGIVRRFLTLLKTYYEVDAEIVQRVIDRFDSHNTYTSVIKKGAEVIINDLNLFKNESKYRANLNEEKMNAILRGAFLARGSVNAPQAKSLHLEISLTDGNEILFIQHVMNNFELNGRVTKRKNLYVVYIKSKDSITDFLYHVGATLIMEKYQNELIKKEAITNAKRGVNLDLANQDRTNNASREQIKYLMYLKYNFPLETMDQKLLMVMKVRLEHPDYSLTELLEVIHEDFEPTLSKSGLNHRLRKLKEMAEKLKESE